MFVKAYFIYSYYGRFLRVLFTALILLCFASLSYAAGHTRHPIIGDKPPRELLNSDLLALPDRERQAWVNGAANMTAQIVAIDRPETAGCVANWFVRGGNGQEKLDAIMREYPDQRATSTVFAVARLACNDL